MADFKTALEAMARGDLSREVIADNIEKLISRKPAAALVVMTRLREAYGADVIDAQTYAFLKKVVAEQTASTSRHGDPTRLGDQTTFATDDATQHSDYTDNSLPGSGRKTLGGNTDSSIDFDPTGDSPSPTYSPQSSGVTEAKIQPGAVLKERFKLDEVLGVGGMGTVYRGRDLIKVEARDKNPYVALKVLNEDFKKHPDSFIALQREASRQQKLAHPNIATVYDFDRTSGGTVFLTMEMLEGQPLNTFIKKEVKARGGLPFAEAFPMIQGLGNALVYAHERNIVHSDFKPGNCFLTKDNIMKVLDFGIARAVKNPGQGEGEKTLFDPSKLGALTPAYASAEMLEGLEPDPRDDIYALACVAYELLTSRHPFNKLPANSARDNKLVPAPIKGLKRKQMRGLLRGLAFNRSDRSQSVAQFLQELEGRTSPLKNPFIVVPATIVLIAVAGVYPALNAFHQRDIEHRIALAQSGDAATINQVLDHLTELDNPSDRDQVLVAARDAILKSFEQQVNTKVDIEKHLYDFAGARALIAKLAAFPVYKDSAQVNQLQTELNERENVLLALQTEIYNRALEKQALLPDPAAEDVNDALDVIAKFAPAVLDPLRRRLPGAYAAAIDRALASNDFERADALSTNGLKLIPDNKNLINLTDKISGARERAELTAKVLALTAHIRDALADVSSLASLLPVQDAVAQLAEVDPNNSLIETVRKQIAPLVEKDLNALRGAKAWGSSELVQDDYSHLLGAVGLSAQKIQAGKFRDEFIAEVNQLLTNIIGSIAKQSLSPPATPNAVGQLTQLAQMAPRHPRTQEARDIVAHSFLRAARLARAKEDYARAQAETALAAAQQPAPRIADLVQAEQATIAAESTATADARTQRRSASASAFAAGFAKLKQDLQNPAADPAAVAAALAAYDKLESLSPNSPQLVDAADLVTQATSSVADQLGTAGEWDEALRVSRNALAYVPASGALVTKLAALETAERAARLDADRKLVAARKTEVETLLATPAADRTWNNQVQQKMADIQALAADDPWYAQHSEKLAAIYVEKAKAMRAAERFAEGANLLDRAQRYAANLPALVTERQALNAATAAFEQEQREQERLARIEGYKQTFETQAAANDVANATKTLDRITAEVGADDAYVSGDAPRVLGRAYYKLATDKAEAKDFAAALKFAKAGLKLQPKNQELRLAVKEYTVDGNRQDLAGLFARGEVFDLAEVLEKISEVQTLDPRAYGESENNWAQAVAGRLKVLQQTDGDKVNPLLDQAKQVFAGNQMIAALEPAGPIGGAPSEFAAEIDKAIDRALLTKARELLTTAVAKEAEHPDIVRLKGTYNAQLKQAKTLYDQYKEAFRAKEYDNANTIIDKALKIWSDSTTFQKEKSRVVAALQPAGTMREETAELPPPPSKFPCDEKLAGHGKRKQGVCFDMVGQQARGPLMVVVPAGTGFGKAFAIGKFEVTVGDFNTYCRLSGKCQPAADSETSLPITNVSLDQITAYAQWLSTRTGRTYRLPTTEEWVYAAEAAGQQPQKDYNCRVEQSGQVLKGQSVMGVNTGKANGWGLYNYVGNVQEMVKAGGGIVVRGGAYEDTFSKCGISLEKPSDGRPSNSTGFRLVLDLG